MILISDAFCCSVNALVVIILKDCPTPAEAGFDSGLLTDGKNGRYRLNAHLDDLRQPVFGASLTVSSKIHYVVLDTKTNRAIFEKTIDLPYTAAFSEAFAAVKRLRLANEGAIRVNIEALINELISLDIADVEF